MKVEKAKHSGFCFGVKRAVESTLNTPGEVKTLGPLIHNPQFIADLESKGIKAVDSVDDIDKGTLIIRTHGVPDSVIEKAKEKSINVVDLTCPFVKKVHDVAKKAEQEGRKVLVFGNKDHPEVKGIIGNLKNFKVLNKDSYLLEEDLSGKLTLVSQTTRDIKEFEEITKKIKEINKDLEVENTICSATRERQQSAIDLAKNLDIIIVIGSKISSNTIRLNEICQKYCDTKHVENAEELRNEWFIGKKTVGVTAGASTPDSIIDQVVERIENEF